LVSGNPIKQGVCEAVTTRRGWRIVAGPTVDLHLATVGAEDAVKAADRANRGYWREASKAALFQRDTPPLNVIGRGAYKLPGAPVIDLGSPRTASAAVAVEIGDGLDIPDFLRR
jgi:hypothetical protein